jgi:hypothetical protein
MFINNTINPILGSCNFWFYFGLREALVHWFETRKMLKRKEEETRNQVVLMRNYINTQLEKVTKYQNSIDHNLICTRGLLGKLKEFLNSGSPKTFT